MKTKHAFPRKLDEQELELKIAQFAQRVGELFNAQIVNDIARQTNFVERESKLTGHLFLTVFTFGVSIYGTPSLNDLVGLLNMVAPHVDIERQSLHERIDESAVAFFEKMLSLAIAVELPQCLSEAMAAMGSCFKRVILFDSTSFQLPPELAKYFRGSGGGASEAAIKILFGYDLQSGEFFYLLQEGIVHDNFSQNHFHQQMQPGDLEISDLGFFNIRAFADIDERGAYYLSRLRADVKLYLYPNDQLEEFDVARFAQSLTQERAEIQAYLKAGNVLTKTNLIVERVPEQVKAARLRKQNRVNRKKGHTTRKRVRMLAGFNLYITNAPAAKIPRRKIRLLYGLRWQIELIFKSWKSNFALSEVRGKRPARIKCLIYAKLLWIFITTKIIHTVRDWVWVQQQQEVSGFQAAKYLNTIAHQLLVAIIQQPRKLSKLLVHAMTFIKEHCIKSRTRKRVHPLELLQELGP